MTTRMKPASTTQLDVVRTSTSTTARVEVLAARGSALWSMTTVGMPAVCARDRAPPAEATLEMTTPTLASSVPAAMASRIAWKFVPEPEQEHADPSGTASISRRSRATRALRRRVSCGHGDDVAEVDGRPRRAARAPRSSARPRSRRHDEHEADAEVEGAAQLVLLDGAAARDEVEERRARRAGARSRRRGRRAARAAGCRAGRRR